MRYLKSRAAFSLIEIVIVIIVLGICLTPVAILFQNILVKYEEPEAIQVAVSLAEQEMERVTGLRFSSINSQAQTGYTGNFANYNYEVIVTPVPLGLADDPTMQEYKHIEIRVKNDPVNVAVSLISVASRKKNII